MAVCIARCFAPTTTDNLIQSRLMVLNPQVPKLVLVKTAVMLLAIFLAGRVCLYPAENGRPNGMAGFCWL
jgi:hypothetical protein